MEPSLFVFSVISDSEEDDALGAAGDELQELEEDFILNFAAGSADPEEERIERTLRKFYKKYPHLTNEEYQRTMQVTEVTEEDVREYFRENPTMDAGSNESADNWCKILKVRQETYMKYFKDKKKRPVPLYGMYNALFITPLKGTHF